MFEIDYLRNLTELISAKRKQSIEEFSLTDLKYKSIEDIHKWYNNLIALIQKSPPSNYVKGIVVKENKDGNAEELVYKYFDNPSVSLSITILEI